MIEIDEVLVPTMASGLSDGQRLAKICRLTSSFSVAASITRSQSPKSSKLSAGAMLAERGLALLLGDALARDLPRHVAVDGRDAGLDAVGRDIVEQDVEAGQRADMGDAAAHLTGADHADGVDDMRLLGARRRTFSDFTHGRVFVLSRASLYADP